MAGMALDRMTRITLNDGHTIPPLGLGVFQIEDATVCERAVAAALDCGYRHIDTAAIYGNEEAVGRAISRSGIPREELFVTTKCWVDDFGREATRKAFDASRKKLGLDVIDLYLLHWPVDETMMGAWETLADLRAEGAVRSIGVSNFTVRRFEEFFLPSHGCRAGGEPGGAASVQQPAGCAGVLSRERHRSGKLLAAGAGEGAG